MEKQPDLQSSIQELASDDFESLVASVWSEMGWTTEVTSTSRDQGIDIIARKSGIVGEKVVIQAKGYNSESKVGRPEIQQYNTLRQQESDVDAVIVVTSSEFTSEADELAENLSVKTVNGEQLTKACIEYLSENQLSNISASSSNPSNKQLDSPGNTEREVNIEDISKSEADLADLYEMYLMRLRENGSSTNLSLLFDIEYDGIGTSRYSVTEGSVHQIKSDSIKTLQRFARTIEEYEWNLVTFETYKKGAGGVEIVSPLDEASMFYLIVDTSSERTPSAKRQAKITNLILKHFFDEALSGMVVRMFSPEMTDGGITRVIQ
jgi:hypothetical protein